jgi:hypothetical protein
MKSREAEIQSACVHWFRYQFPKLAPLLFAVPNGGSRNPIEAKNLKAQGVVPGVSDLILLVPSSGFSSLCIEMKNGKNSQTEYQVAFQQAAEKAGNKYVVCRSVDDFIFSIKNYLK